jgi:methanogen homocitrate synthase
VVVSDILDAAPHRLCIHCHNDLGFAAANTVTAAAAGAFQLHTTVNGIGERAGNAALEQVLVTLRMKGGVDRYDLSRLQEISQLVARSSGVFPERTRPIVGENAFAHESGIHIAAILEDPSTYEYILPELVGGERRFVLGKHTGRKALDHIAQAYGFELSDAEARWVLEQIKQRSEGKCSVTPEVLCGFLRQAKGGVLQ